MSRRRNIYVRHWRIIRALSGRRYGLAMDALIEEVETSRSTLYRDIAVLREAGVPIDAELRNGQARYHLRDQEVPPLQPTAIEYHALRLARSMLTPLEGSSLARHLDDLLDRVPKSLRPAGRRISMRRGAVSDPSVLANLERALDKNRRLRIHYRGTRDPRPRWRVVDPLAMRLAGDHVYLVAHDLEARAARTFKAVRISRVDVLTEQAASHPAVDHDALFAHSVKVWTGEPIEVVIRIDSTVAHLVREWPLPGQSVADVPDGVLVRARVAGIEETVRWVLGWGRHALPVEPSELVEAVRRELEGALEGLERSRLKDRGTRVVQEG